MFSVNIDKLVSMTPAEAESFGEAADVVLTQCETRCRTVSVVGDGLSAFKLAYAMSEKGKNVLFIDADTKSDIFLLKYRLGKDLKGFTDYLVNAAEVKELVCMTNSERMGIMFTGEPEQAGELSGYGGRIACMLAEALDTYDYVVILADDGRVAACCGETVIIMKRSEYTETAADDLTNELSNSGCNVMGVIIGE